jgi:hypothetical protein
MKTEHGPYAKQYRAYALVSTLCLFLSALAGAFLWLSPRMRLLPSYIFFFSFAASSVMLFQTVLTRSRERLPELNLHEPTRTMIAAVIVSLLSVISELAAAGWLKIPAGIILGITVLFHGYCIWRGFTPREIWEHVALRFFITDMFFLLVAAVGLSALGWKETWPETWFIPDFLRPSTVFLGASFPLTLTFTGFLYLYAEENEGLSPREARIFDWWYYILVSGVLSFLVVILLDLRVLMQTMALILAVCVFVVTALFAGRLARNPRSIGMLFAFVGSTGLLAASTAGNCLIASNTPTFPAGENPLLLSHVHMAQLGWVCISFWGILYVLWPMMLRLDTGKLIWLPLLDDARPMARNLAIVQLVLAVGGLTALVVSHLLDHHTLMVLSGLVFAAATLVPLPMLKVLDNARTA